MVSYLKLEARILMSLMLGSDHTIIVLLIMQARALIILETKILPYSFIDLFLQKFYILQLNTPVYEGIESKKNQPSTNGHVQLINAFQYFL